MVVGRGSGWQNSRIEKGSGIKKKKSSISLEMVDTKFLPIYLLLLIAVRYSVLLGFFVHAIQRQLDVLCHLNIQY